VNLFSGMIGSFKRNNLTIYLTKYISNSLDYFQEKFQRMIPYKGEERAMEEYNHLVERQRKWMLYLLVFFLIAILMTPYERLFMSLLLGYVAGYYLLRLTQARIKRFTETILTEGKTRSLGSVI